MTSYSNFIGIDIGKFTFVSCTHGTREVLEYENNPSGIAQFLKDNKHIIKQSLCVMEATGGYELELLYTLSDRQIAVHRADGRKVKNFIRSYGNDAKTDKLDAKALAKYAAERAPSLLLFTPQSKNSVELFQQVQRRNDLKQMLVAEKNRSQLKAGNLVKNSIKQMITMLSSQIESLNASIQALIDADPALSEKKKILQTIPGIGAIIASELLVLLPELGTINRRQIASLAGLAPKANDSGARNGYRCINKGRSGIKPILFMAAMAARNSNSHLKIFYEKLINNGKKKMVALTALMRKIIVIANAKIQHNYTTSKHS